MSFSIRYGVTQSPHPIGLPISIHIDKKQSSRVALPSKLNQKRIGVVGEKFPILSPVTATSGKSQMQNFIDLLRDYSGKGHAKQAKAIHGFVLKSNFSDKDMMMLLNHLTHTYSKCSEFGYACRVFDKMSQRNVFSWTVIIVGSTEHGFFLDGFGYFVEMLNEGILLDKFACSAVIQTCIGLDCVKFGQMVHSQIVIRGFVFDSFVCTSLLNMYAKFGKIEESCRVFNSMIEHNEVSWNSMISGLTLNGVHQEAYDHFLRMKSEGAKVNLYTLISASKAVGQLGDVNKARQIQRVVSQLHMDSNVVLGTALIDMYSKCGSLKDARYVLDSNFSYCEVNTPWNAMISGYSQCGCSEETLKLYVRMCEFGIESDMYTYCSVFNAIADSKYLTFGKEVHGRVLKRGNDMTALSVYNAAADAYGKCGAPNDARKVFETMEERNLVTWTTMVSVYSRCCEWEEALAVFSKMRQEDFQPNQFTFSSVLVSCSGLCFLDYGKQVHGLLVKASLDTDQCIESALLDMYAKCGSIIEAEKIFERSYNRDTVSWTAMLAGYAQHGMTDDALRLFRRMELHGTKPNAVTFLCILFACSHGGMVEEGLRYFELMKERYGMIPEMEHYACIIDLLGRVGHLTEALEFITNMPIKPDNMVWQALLGACRIHGNVELAEIAARKILKTNPEYSAPYVLLSNTYKESGSVEYGVYLRDVMKDRGVRKEPGYSWIYSNSRVHRFCAGDKQHARKDEIYWMLEELSEMVKWFGSAPELRLES